MPSNFQIETEANNLIEKYKMADLNLETANTFFSDFHKWPSFTWGGRGDLSTKTWFRWSIILHKMTVA